ncbi:hypothetical protein ACIP93_07550 [Streptomyces sp. NPDC088745]|uniref:hypothetical protein n=1 Tax=Streptomyces sp. NPDC088745 TaxID=3365884 RepID=UPI0037F7455A
MVQDDERTHPGPVGEAGDSGGPAVRSAFSTGKAGPRLRLTPVNVLLVVLGLVIGIGTGWLVQDRPAGAPQPPPAPRAAPGPGSPARATGASPRPSPPALPADFAVVRDASGVTLAVPSGWRRDVGASVHYRSPSSPYSRFLQFWPLPDSRMSATRALRVTVAAQRHYPRFEVHSLHPTTKGAAELVHSYDSLRTGRRLTLVQRVFPAADGRRYAFAVVGPAGEWPRQRNTLEAALRHFEPVRDTP